MDQNNNEAKWYVAHTYSGYENKVKAFAFKLFIVHCFFAYHQIKQ